MTEHPSIRGIDQVVDILADLHRELETGAAWENDTLPRFLEGFAALLGSIENSYSNSGQPVPDDPWVIVGDALKGARHYE